MDSAYKPTTNGRACMAACMALEKPLTITRVAFGSGLPAEDANLADIHQLLAFVSDGAVADRRHQDDRFCLTIQFANDQHPEVKTFLLSEFIVYAQDPTTGEETDLLYGTLGDYRQPVPAYHPAYPPSVFNFPLELILSDEINVSVAAPAGIATWEDIAQVAAHQVALTIPASGWVQTGTGKYPYSQEIPVDGVTAQMIPSLIVLEEGEDAAVSCGLCPRLESIGGAIRVFASVTPTADIPACLTLQGDVSRFMPQVSADGLPVATESRAGAVRPGAGLTVSSDGTLSVVAANEKEVDEMLTGVIASGDKN